MAHKGEPMLFNNRIRQEDLPLTLLEQQYIKLSSEGLSIAEIGARIFRSPHTVKRELSYCYKKLKARNRAHAVALYIRNYENNAQGHG